MTELDHAPVPKRGIALEFWQFCKELAREVGRTIAVAAIIDSRIIRREGDLFGGALLSLLGLLTLQHGRYCDGNASDYLSCTRPNVFYYFGWFNIVLIVLGITFILLWAFKRSRQRS